MGFDAEPCPSLPYFDRWARHPLAFSLPPNTASRQPAPLPLPHTPTGLHELSGSQLQDLHKEYRLLQPIGEKYEEFQKLRQEVGVLPTRQLPASCQTASKGMP